MEYEIIDPFKKFKKIKNCLSVWFWLKNINLCDDEESKKQINH